MSAQISPLSIAFQPIVSATVSGVVVYGYEALARIDDGTVPALLLSRRFSNKFYAFDYRCRKLALETACKLSLSANLSLNITPGAILHSEFGMERTLRDAAELGFPASRMIFEITEREPIDDYYAVRVCIDKCRAQGVRIALDDFGTGFNGLNTLIELRPDTVKVDMSLIRKIETDADRQALMFGICAGGDKLGMRLVAEGVETLESVATLSAGNIDLMQGYFFARPARDQLPIVNVDVEINTRMTLGALPYSAAVGDMRGTSHAA